MTTTTDTAPPTASTSAPGPAATPAQLAPVPTAGDDVGAMSSATPAAASASAAPAAAPEAAPVGAPTPAPATAAAAADGASVATVTTAAVKDVPESITTKVPSTITAKPVAVEEKATESVTPKAAPAAAASAPPKSSPAPAPKAAQKKRRKRGGLTGLFVALGCISSDEFDDDAPNKTKVPANTASTTVTPAAAPKSTVANPASATPNGTPATKARDAPKESPPSSTAESKAASDPKVVIPSAQPTTAPLEETAGLTSSAVQAPGSGSEILQHHLHHHPNSSEHHIVSTDGGNRTADYTDLSESDGDDVPHHDLLFEDEYEDEEDRLIAQGGIGIPVDENGNPAPLLPPIGDIDIGRKCLVLDLDETLLHSSFKMLPSADYIVPVEIESQTHNVYVIKRPGVDHFLQEMGKIYEIVVFTASLSKYADPVLDMLDVGRVVRHRLFRESCYNHKGNYVKDLSQLGREMSTAIIIDNSPASYIFHPNNAVPVSTWFNDPHDTELTDLCPFLTDLATVDDVRGVLDGSI